MFDTREQIRSQLRAGEDGRAEFKEVRFGDRSVLSPAAEEFAGELVAFANAEGGVVFPGVDDSERCAGFPRKGWRRSSSWLFNVTTHNCNPKPRLPRFDYHGCSRSSQVQNRPWRDSSSSAITCRMPRALSSTESDAAEPPMSVRTHPG